MPLLRDTDEAVRDATSPPGKQVERFRLRGHSSLYLYVRSNGKRDWYVRYKSPVSGNDIARHLASAVWSFSAADVGQDKPLDRVSAKSRASLWMEQVARGRDPYLEQKHAEQEASATSSAAMTVLDLSYRWLDSPRKKKRTPGQRGALQAGSAC
jgi:Arm DNA-binding domain